MRCAWLALALLAGCDGDATRESSTVRRDQPIVHTGDGVVVDAIEDVAPEPDSVGDSASPAETVPETIVDTTPETIADTTPETIADTAQETVVDTTPDTTTDTGPIEGDPCVVGSLVGDCRHISDCAADEIAAEGFCDGGPRIRCCLPSADALDRCSANRAPGACMATASCPGPAWKSTSGLCPGAADIQCCTSTTAPLPCDPDVRPTPNDGLFEEPGDPGCPPGMVRLTGVADFCIDRFEASLVRADDPAVSLSPYHNPGTTSARAVSMRWAVPQGYIDEVRAKAACQNGGKRLCSTDEWLFACQGPSGWTYPYGAAREPGRCNDDRRQHVAVEYFGTTDSWIFSEIDNACLTQLPASLDLAGENDGCQTPTGIYDLMGNLHEWVDDAAGTFRGGFFDDTTINGAGCLYRTTARDVNHWDYSTGFRCCADVAP